MPKIKKSKAENEVTDLIVEEDDLLTFNQPDYISVRSAYSQDFKPKKNITQHINQLFPWDNKEKAKIKDEDPGYSIDEENDTLLI